MMRAAAGETDSRARNVLSKKVEKKRRSAEGRPEKIGKFRKGT